LIVVVVVVVVVVAATILVAVVVVVLLVFLFLATFAVIIAVVVLVVGYNACKVLVSLQRLRAFALIVVLVQVRNNILDCVCVFDLGRWS